MAGKSRARKALDPEDEEEDKKVIVLSSTDDEEANRDISLEIVERARRREAKRMRAQSSQVIDVPSSDEHEVLVPMESTKKKKKRKKKLQTEEKLVGEEEKEKIIYVDPAAQREPVIYSDSVDEVNETDDNVVLKKLLRGPRYFDSEGCNWQFCYNCSEEGHTAANCKSEKRQKPCFVCGLFGHNPKSCTQGHNCFICKRRGHDAKECPDKEKRSSHNSRLCLRCGDLGHDMALCTNDYAVEDLKEIQCYVCKKFGHLCCVDDVDTGPISVSCYNCGLAGHSGAGCAKPRFQVNVDPKKTNGDPPTLCYKCGEEGHFARGCLRKTKLDQWIGEASTPVPKIKRKGQFLGSRSAPNDFGKSRKKKHMHYVEKNTTAAKSRGGWIVDDPGDYMPHENYNKKQWRSWKISPSTSSKKGKKSPTSKGMPYSSSRSSYKSHKSFPRTPNSSSSGCFRPSYNADYKPSYSSSKFNRSTSYY